MADSDASLESFVTYVTTHLTGGNGLVPARPLPHPRRARRKPLRDAQARLDLAVRAAYGMPKDADILAFLLALNQTCAAKEGAGDPITAPGLPLPVEEHAAFITEDCINV